MINSCFATKEFMDFAHGANSYSFITENSCFPVKITSSTINLPGNKSISFPAVTTPICFSGPDQTFFKQQNASTSDLILDLPECINNSCNSDAGFVQTRIPIDSFISFPSIFKRNGFDICLDTRSAYLLNYGCDVATLLSLMRKDSKQRCTRILKSSESYEFIASADMDEHCKIRYVQRLSHIYKRIGTQKNFSADYLFTYDDWLRLFSSSLWTFHVLRDCTTDALSFAVIGETAFGHEYAFAVAEPSKMDLSRAMILFSYLYLSARNNPKFGGLNLGGGITQDDSLASFKSSMGAKRINLARIKFSKYYIGECLGSLNHLHNFWPI